MGCKWGLPLQTQLEAWEPNAEPTRESWARASQPSGHRDMLPDRPTNAIALGQLCARHNWGGGGRCLLAKSHTPTAGVHTGQFEES